MRSMLLIATVATVATALVATTAPAFAGDSFDEFVADLNGKPAAAAAYLQDCQMVVTPRGEVRQPCALTVADLVGSAAGVTLKVKANKVASFPRSQLEWRDATVEARAGKRLIATFHVVEVGSSGGNPDVPSGWMRASHWSRVIADKDARALARAGKLVAPPAIAAGVVPLPEDAARSAQDQSDRAQATETLQQALDLGPDAVRTLAGWADGGAVIFGSGPKQRYTGKKGAAALRAWKLALAPHGGVTVAGGRWVLWGVTHMVGTPTDKAATPITYVVFAVFTSSLTPGGGSFVTEPALVQFAIAQ